MKFLKSGLIVFSLFVIFLTSCKNDLKLNAPYKEIPSIYAVLNPQDRIQIIRINKVFLGESDANVMAQVADSVNYPAGEITVTLDRYINGAHVNAIPGKQTLTFRDSMVTAADGSFNKNQRVYVCSDDLHQGTRGQTNYAVSGDYVLTVKNNHTGNIFTAKSTAMDSVKGSTGYVPIRPPYYPYIVNTSNQNDFIDYVSVSTPVTVKFAPNTAAAYQLTMRVHFYDPINSGNSNHIDYVFGNKTADETQKVAQQDMIVYSFTRDDFFTAMGVSLSRLSLNHLVNPGRQAYKIEYLIYSTTQDYLDYIQFVAPSLSISQTKPLYSNFDNGAALGLFTFTTRCSVSKEMASVFINEFSRNKYTCAYGFVDASGAYLGCDN